MQLIPDWSHGGTSEHWTGLHRRGKCLSLKDSHRIVWWNLNKYAFILLFLKNYFYQVGPLIKEPYYHKTNISMHTLYSFSHVKTRMLCFNFPFLWLGIHCKEKYFTIFTKILEILQWMQNSLGFDITLSAIGNFTKE